MRVLILFLAAVLFWSRAASAHPHIYADYKVQVEAGTAGIRVLHFLFTFDDMYTTIISSELHVAGMPQLDTKNTKMQKNNPVDFLVGQHFFLFVTADGAALPPQEIHITSANRTADGSYDFDFTLPVAAQKIVFSVYDPTYYLSVLQLADALVAAPPNIKCDTQTKDITPTIWGMLQAQEVSCAAAQP